MMDREERSVVCTCAINVSVQNCALRIATAFSKGTQHTLGFYELMQTHSSQHLTTTLMSYSYCSSQI